MTTIKLIFFILVLGGFYFLEERFPKRALEIPHLQRLKVHGTLAILNTVFMRLLITGPLFFWLTFVREREGTLSQLLGLSGLFEIIISVIVLDMLDYWWHRWNHRIPFLWLFHKVHHLDTHVDVTTSLRFHPGELFLSAVMKALWILVWGPSLWAFVIFEITTSAYAQFHHSNIDLTDKWEKMIRWIHMTPRVHASHHTVKDRTRDANFSTIFSIWDRLFGTFQEPDFEEMKQLGLPYGRESYLSLSATLRAPLVSSKV